MERIPEYLLKDDILLKLPVTSVMRFMCTCKTYYDMISSDCRFAEAYRQRGRASDQKVLLVADGQARSLNCNSFVITDLNLPKPCAETKDVRVIGSYGGLVCLLLSSQTFVLWNPTTKEFRKLPVTLSSNNSRRTFYGLGYDSLLCDHRVVVIVNPVITNGNHCDERNHCVLDYSLRSKSVSYKLRPNMINFEPTYDCAVYSNHHLHWQGETLDPFCPDPDMTREVAILSYNLQEETFGYVPMPDIDYAHFQGVTDIKDNFCAFFYSSDNPCFEVWIMKEYSVRSSWTLLYCFDDHQHVVNHYYLWDAYKLFVGVSDDGYLVMDNRADLCIIEPVDGAPSRCRLNKLVTKEAGWVRMAVQSRSWIYEESFISPNSGDVSLDQVGKSRVVHRQGYRAGESASIARKRKLDKRLRFKTAICNAWRRTGNCPLGEDCSFAHGMLELRDKVCLNVLNCEPCPFGELCKYQHNLKDFERRYGENERTREED